MGSSGPFPPEIILRIAYYLTHDRINSSLGADAWGNWGRVRGAARYASLNQTWQDAVERETFADLRLDLGRLAEADAIFNRAGVQRRQKYVRTIRLNVVLPPPSGPGKPARLEPAAGRDSEKQTNDRVLQETLEAFLTTLRHWTPAGPQASVALHLDAYRLDVQGSRERPPLSAPYTYTHTYRPPLELEDPERVLRCGPVRVVTELHMGRSSSIRRPISGGAVCALVARMPAAKIVSFDWVYAGGDPKHRSASAQAVAKITHPFDRFEIGGTYAQLHPPEQPAQQQQQQQANQYEAKPDELSQTLGLLSQRVARMFDLYDVIVSDDLFLQHSLPPEIASSPSTPAHWARLETFHLRYAPVTPSGEWLFHYSHPAHSHRRNGTVVVATPALRRRYLAAARAALEMPLLQNMTLEAQLQLDVEGEREGDRSREPWHKFCYCRGVRRRRRRIAYAAKLTWTTSSDGGFEPEDEVVEAWREVARRHVGGGVELEVEVLDDEDAL